ncbi:Eukaryotic translation initiation factor 3 subunit M [Camellia lanceoleosa]|uniref:Eukaryotic translation initiation factor 3 subunit M n=1 Tax=Camellia lanceoleosa TaxID=1840588 RepID=A0ACC0IYF8_9ERIC|nr:Eukaryotic translation initiation factor 3 subunit M [Camellia lanceoleosa]
MDNLLMEWNIGVQDQRKLYCTIANILKDSKSLARDSFKFLTKYLATFSGEDAYNIGEAKEEAVRTIIEFVKAPDMFQCDLLDMPAVAQLEKDAKYALVYQLLKIFLTQQLDAYLDFYEANSTLLKSYGLIREDFLVKMRLMSLVDLASTESGQISYPLIKDTLQVNDDKVEMWVVKAVTAKLIDCKMHQMNQIVIVSCCTERIFGQHQWQTLQEKLVTWRGELIALERLREFVKIAWNCLLDQGTEWPSIDDVVQSLQIALQLQQTWNNDMEMGSHPKMIRWKNRSVQPSVVLITMCCHMLVHLT